MTGLESILAQITGDAKQEAEAILAQGRKQAAATLEAAQAEAAERSREALAQGEADAAAIRERASSATQLQRRNRMLAFKQQLIQEALEAGLASLENAPDQEYFDALLVLAARYAPKGLSEMRLSAKDLGRLPASFAARLREAVPQGEITLSPVPWDIGPGFLLVTGDIDINCTFRALFEDLRDPLRDTVGKLLFPQGS